MKTMNKFIAILIQENLTQFKRSDTRKMEKRNAWYESM